MPRPSSPNRRPSSSTDSISVIGVDFTSRPRASKGITVAHGLSSKGRLTVDRVDTLFSFEEFETLLRSPGPWIGAFDFPFGLPRELVLHLGWPTDWLRATERLRALERSELRRLCQAFCDARPVGNKLAHRETDKVARSSSSMKWVNPPVAYMLHEGAPRLMLSGVTIPGVFLGDSNRVALEGYPALLAREVTTSPYKNDARAKQTDALTRERRAIVRALERGATSLGIRLSAPRHLLGELVLDASGDRLDAVLCAMQASFAAERRNHDYGLPDSIDALEGWIVTARA